MGKVIALINQKGGVGKTATTFNFGAVLAEKGKKVLLLDLDFQGNLTQACGVRNSDELDETIATGIKELMEDKDKITFPIHKYRDNIDFIPCNVSFSEVKLEMIFATSREMLLKTYLRPIKDRYDYILIDCHPDIGIDFINALSASDEVIVITEPELYSTTGTELLFRSINKVKKHLNPDIEVAGILCNKVDRRTRLAKDMIEAIRETWGKVVKIFDTEIPFSVKIKESPVMATPIIEYERDSKAAQSYILFTEEYLKGEN